MFEEHEVIFGHLCRDAGKGIGSRAVLALPCQTADAEQFHVGTVRCGIKHHAGCFVRFRVASKSGKAHCLHGKKPHVCRTELHLGRRRVSCGKEGILLIKHGGLDNRTAAGHAGGLVKAFNCVLILAGEKLCRSFHIPERRGRRADTDYGIERFNRPFQRTVHEGDCP